MVSFCLYNHLKINFSGLFQHFQLQLQMFDKLCSKITTECFSAKTLLQILLLVLFVVNFHVYVHANLVRNFHHLNYCIFSQLYNTQYVYVLH